MDFDRLEGVRPRPFSRSASDNSSKDDERPAKRLKKLQTPNLSESSADVELLTPLDSIPRPAKHPRQQQLTYLSRGYCAAAPLTPNSHSYASGSADELAPPHEAEMLETPISDESGFEMEEQAKTMEEETTPRPGFLLEKNRESSIQGLASHSNPSRSKQAYVEVGTSSYPRSAFDFWEPPLPVASERSALRDLVAVSNDSDDGCIYLQLDEFSIYRPDTTATATRVNNANELTCLSRLSLDRFGEFVFDGILTSSTGGRERYVQGVRFKIMTIQYDGSSAVWIQSTQAARQSIWFKLGRPSPEYRRFYTPFLYLVRFTRHFLDFLTKGHDEGISVCLNDFKLKFYDWLRKEGKSESLASARLQDFRTTVVANHGLLWSQWTSTGGESNPSKRHPLWSEIDPLYLAAIPAQPIVETKTIVTPFAYACFPLYFQSELKPLPITDDSVKQRCAARKKRFGLTPLRSESQGIQPKKFDPVFDADVSDVAPRDVVCVRPFNNQQTWAKSGSKTWYAYVQDVSTTRTGRKLLDVIWLYETCDTTIGNATFLFPNELFFSDNCDCGSTAVEFERVFAKVDVSWFSEDPYLENGFFVRQKFRTVSDEDTYDFVRLSHDDFTCICRKDVPSEWTQSKAQYSTGDAVLVAEKDKLVPAWIQSFNDDKQDITIQYLKFKYPGAPNELVFPGKSLKTVKPGRLIRKCQFRIFDRQQSIPVPYDRGGAGDFYFMRGKLGDIPTEIQQGWHPLFERHDKLAGLALFCGGGNFDRGIEEGNCVEVKYAVDLDNEALHSHRANAADPKDVQYFLGSVNDYLAQAMAGKNCPLVATSGDVGLLLLGAPCQGYSLANNRKLDPQAIRNASMIASVVANADFYVPGYLILENVPNMSSTQGPLKENVFSHVIAALVAMGYQVQQFMLDAWRLGSPQGRSRLFIIATAPGFPPLRQPAQTHADYSRLGSRKRALGELSNGCRFARRQMGQLTPFKHVSPAEATKDLPPLGEILVQLCPPFPDHRVPIEANKDIRDCIALVPKDPQGMTLALADLEGKVSGKPLEMLRKTQKNVANPEEVKSYSRVFRDGVFSTFVTHIQIRCRNSGRYIHWDEDRVVSVMEVRRGVGCPDHEVLLGSTATQIHIMGNCVDRKVALALGLSLRESWLECIQRGLIPPRDDHDE